MLVHLNESVINDTTQHNTQLEHNNPTTLTTSLEDSNKRARRNHLYVYLRQWHENVNIEMSLQVSSDRQSNRFPKMWKNGAFGWGYLRPIKVF